MGQSVMFDKSPPTYAAMTDAPAAPPLAPPAAAQPHNAAPQPTLPLFPQHHHAAMMQQHQHYAPAAPTLPAEHAHMRHPYFPAAPVAGFQPPGAALVFPAAPGTGGVSSATMYGYPVLQTMQPAIPIMDHTGIFLAGFRDCAAEAIKYLTEMESMSGSDPAIQGLRHHLDDRQDTLKSNSDSGSPKGSSDSPSSSHSTPLKSKVLSDSSVLDEGYGSILMSDASTNSTPCTPKSSSLSSSSFSSPYSPYPHHYPHHYHHHHHTTQTHSGLLSHPVMPMFTMASLPASPIAAPSTMQHQLVPPACIQHGTSTPVFAPHRSQSPELLLNESCITPCSPPPQSLHTPHCSPEKQLPDLAELAQNNPAIASVAAELMELLEEEFLEEEGAEEDFCEEDEEEEMDSEGEVIVHDEEDQAERSS